MAAGSTERTSGYFGDQTPSESKSPVSQLQLHLFPCLFITFHSFLGLWQIFYKGALLRLKAFSALGLF
jgi:hypothetical protein